jgi:membrane-associated phospholipid phosphatase
MDAVEPNWGTLRPFVLTSSGEIPIAPPTPYDTAAGSAFVRLAREVRDTGSNLTPEQRAIAGFWDCNPFAVQTEGHYMTALKKISPGGHWMGITAIALRRAHADMLRSAEAYTRVSLALSDGFVSAWREKYHSVRVRPVTVIQQGLDPSWQPLLQTPPFPEYPSAHSVISAAAAAVLSDLFGGNYAFTDSTELAFGLPPRSFASFEGAAHEAAMSRMYGGIHYRDAAENGLLQGAAIGETIVARIHTSGASTLRRAPRPERLSQAQTPEARDHAD